MINSTTCSILYYPGQDAKFGCMVGHADLEFKGTVYTFGSGRQSEVQLNKRIKKAQNGGLPFERFSFQLTKEQSTRLKNILKSKNEPFFLSSLDKSTRNNVQNFIRKFFGPRKARILESTVKNPKIPRSYSCMDFVSNVLQKADIIQIPKIIKISPLLSSIYLRSIRFFGDKQVKDITYYGNSFSSFRNYLTVNFCRLGEIVALSLPILASAYYFDRKFKYLSG